MKEDEIMKKIYNFLAGLFLLMMIGYIILGLISYANNEIKEAGLAFMCFVASGIIGYSFASMAEEKAIAND